MYNYHTDKLCYCTTLIYLIANNNSIYVRVSYLANMQFSFLLCVCVMCTSFTNSIINNNIEVDLGGLLVVSKVTDKTTG